MSTHTNIFIAVVCLMFCSTAHSQPITIPLDDKQSMSIDNINFNGSTFIEAFMSKDVGQRRLAEMYLIGVLDSTEKKNWCGYNIVLPSSIEEGIYIGFKKQSPAALNRRASEIISSILAKRLPCRDEK